MINYHNIKQECPLAFRELINKHTIEFYEGVLSHTWTPYDGGDGGYESFPFNDRDLYDYFDSVGLRIVVTKSNDKATRFDYEIYTNGEVIMGYVAKSRAEAETAAFTKAFQIRNEQLKSLEETK